MEKPSWESSPRQLDQIKLTEEQLKGEYAIKAGCWGPDPELSKEIKILNRLIRWCGDKLEYEADSRHAEMIIEECEVQSWRAAKTPESRKPRWMESRRVELKWTIAK